MGRWEPNEKGCYWNRSKCELSGHRMGLRADKVGRESNGRTFTLVEREQVGEGDMSHPVYDVSRTYRAIVYGVVPRVFLHTKVSSNVFRQRKPRRHTLLMV